MNTIAKAAAAAALITLSASASAWYGAPWNGYSDGYVDDSGHADSRCSTRGPVRGVGRYYDFPYLANPNYRGVPLTAIPGETGLPAYGFDHLDTEELQALAQQQQQVVTAQMQAIRNQQEELEKRHREIADQQIKAFQQLMAAQRKHAEQVNGTVGSIFPAYPETVRFRSPSEVQYGERMVPFNHPSAVPFPQAFAYPPKAEEMASYREEIASFRPQDWDSDIVKNRREEIRNQMQEYRNQRMKRVEEQRIQAKEQHALFRKAREQERCVRNQDI